MARAARLRAGVRGNSVGHRSPPGDVDQKGDGRVRDGPDARLAALAEEAGACRNCGLWEHATQAVFGAGHGTARIVLVGEQPGDAEDRAGEPFVGPAGRVLDEAIAAAGLRREDLYLTNAVKHFKWTARGKRRIHERPNRAEVVACRPWLDAELSVVQPSVLVVLGATAGQALFGSKFRVGVARTAELDYQGFPVVATIHPSAVLRARDSAGRADLAGGLVRDLERARALAEPAVIAAGTTRRRSEQA